MKKQMKPLIVVKDLSLGYGDRVIVHDANFAINRGDIFVIIGLSGSGKSTIMRSMVGLLQPVRGHIFIEGIDMWATDADTRTKIVGRFGVSFQSGALFSSMTIGENVALPMELKSGLSATKIHQRVREKLNIVGLDGYENLYPSEVSGGMIKRAALARALVNNPDVLFFDEPSAGLDPVRSAELDELIKNINRRNGTTIIMVTHELSTIMSIATNAIYVDASTQNVIPIGDPRGAIETIKNPQIVEFFRAGKKGGKK